MQVLIDFHEVINFGELKYHGNTNDLYSKFLYWNFMAHNDMIDTKGKVLKNSFNMKEDTNSTLA